MKAGATTAAAGPAPTKAFCGTGMIVLNVYATLIKTAFTSGSNDKPVSTSEVKPEPYVSYFELRSRRLNAQ